MARSRKGQEGGPKAPIAPGRLRGRTWKRFLRGPDPSLLEELYIPALGESIRYDRCCAYFSSTVLAAAARGFGRLIERLEAMGDRAPRPAVRLVVNEELAEEDVRALTETGDLSKLEATLRKHFRNPTDALEKKRLAMLAWLVRRELLEVRVGVMRRGAGIVHAKFGIVTDEAQDAIVFNGSGNESGQGLLGNYERLEISTSWDDPDRHREYTGEFEALWKDAHPDVHTVTLPEALRLKLVKFAPPEAPITEPSNALPRQKAAMIWRFITEAPYLEGGGANCDATAMVDLWPHQRRVVEEAADAWPEGRLLCDEVGMGKTIEAVLVLRRLMAGRGVRRTLILLPAALLKQWQTELREKGGMICPRLEGTNTIFWPDERTERVSGLAEALERDVLLMSRETARTENNLPLLLAATPWDLVILDESHAARRRKQVEGEFNSGTLLLNLLRQLQLRQRTRGFLLLSATPMQTHPWEPWDLLGVLGEGGAWLSEFSGIRDFYAALAAVRKGRCDLTMARKAAALIAADPDFPEPPGESSRIEESEEIARRIAFPQPSRRGEVARWLRTGSPLARRMHRNTRGTLRRYYELDLLPYPPPRRIVNDVGFDFDDRAERDVYETVTNYIEKRFCELEKEKAGKGFVMTVYRRRASSSPQALERSLVRRRTALLRVVEQKAYDPELVSRDVPEALNPDELPDGDVVPSVSAALPQSPRAARDELSEVDRVLEELRALGARDTKRDRFFEVLRGITGDGRAVLIFTEYTDTLEYLGENLASFYGESLGCYSGEGGRRWDGTKWVAVTKDAITAALRRGELRALICTDAASEGLNLQAAGALINYDLPWNPSRIEQRIGRIDRIGQKLPDVRVVNLFLENSVDDKVYRALRARCGLFEHFVGSMQPVLARARRMLLGQEPFDSGAIEEAAGEVERDPVAEEAYVESPAEAGRAPAAGITRAQIEEAIGNLSGDFGPVARRREGGDRFELAGPGRPKIVFSAKLDVLERDRSVSPLSPLHERLKEMAAGLCRAGERLPLVVGSFQNDSFRCSVAYWVGGGEMARLESLDDLSKRVRGWCGDYPDPTEQLRAEAAARREAERRVRSLEERARRRERVALERQTAAAVLRLEREVGRYLMCADADPTDLNAALYAEMSRDTASAGRLKRAFQKLGDYPDWSTLRRDLEDFAAGLTENQRKARLIGKEIDAALEDPRWLARPG